MASEVLLGLDIGTSATKAVLCDRRGVVIAAASAEHPISRPRPGWSEQDPRDWWRTVVEATRRVISNKDGAAVAAIGLSGQMHGSVFLDAAALKGGGERAEPLRPALLWNDQRTGEQCAQIEKLAGGRRALVELVGNAALPGFTLPKVFWVREHEPDVFKRAAMVLLPKDYIRLRMTGVAATDVGDASGVLVLDVDNRRWSTDACQRFGVDPGLFPPVFESGAVTGKLTSWAAGQLGLRAGTPVVGGSGDNQCGAIGAGVVRPGMVLATLGTSGVIYAHTDRARKDAGAGQAGRIHAMCAATGDDKRPGGWCATGCMLSAGGSLQWCRDTLFPGVPYDALMNEAAAVPPGSGGLVFLPYLTGERCPYPDPAARGGWIGLTSRHTRGHVIRSVLEGVTFGMGQILALFREVGVGVESARIGGGGARSRLWRQMQADVYGCPVALPNTEEGPALGAALLAGVGAGMWSSVEEACAATITECERLVPSPTAAEYAPARAVYERLYHDLKDRFAELSAADRS